MTGPTRAAVAACIVAFGMAAYGQRAAAAARRIELGHRVKVTGGPVAVRAGRKVLATVESGTLLTVIKLHGSWAEVVVESQGTKAPGWIDQKHLAWAPFPASGPLVATIGAEAGGEAACLSTSARAAARCWRRTLSQGRSRPAPRAVAGTRYRRP